MKGTIISIVPYLHDISDTLPAQKLGTIDSKICSIFHDRFRLNRGLCMNQLATDKLGLLTRRIIGISEADLPSPFLPQHPPLYQ
jgi:hypothetical protein